MTKTSFCPFSYSVKAISLLAMLCFCSASILWSAPVGHEPAIRSETKSLRAQLIIPEQVGAIQENFLPQNQGELPTIILIQDVHASYEVQKNIAKILEHLSACEPRLAVGVEGAVSPLRPDLFEFTSNQKTNFKIADTLAQWGELSGAELFSLKTGGKIPVFGIEDESTYRENVRTFRAVMAGKRKIDAELEELKNSLEIDKSKIFKKDIRNFDKEVLNFKSKKTDPDLFCSQIAVRAKKHLNLDLSDLLNQAKWPNLVRLMILKKMEMVSRENAVRSILRSELEGPALFREINALTDRIYFRLAQTPEEKELVERTKRLELRRKIVHLEATRDEVVNSRAESFDRAFFLFYDQAVIREHSMVERLLEHKAPILVLIAGGFHTAGLKKMLKNRGVPFLVVRPRMTKVAGSENYIQAMMETRRSTENVFSSHLAVIRAIVDPEISERLGKNTRRLAETIFRAALSVEKNPETLVELNRLDVFRRNYIQVPFPVKHREFPNLLIPSGFKQLTFGQLEEFTSEEVQRVFSEGQSLGHSNQSSAAKILFSLTLTGFFGCTGVPEPRVSESRQKNPTIITVVNHAQDEHFVKNELTRVRNDLNDIRERRTDAIDPVQTGKITLVAAVHLGGKEVFEREIKPHFDTTYDAAPVTSATRNGKKIFILAEYVPRVEAVMGRPVSLAELGSLLDCGESSIAYRDFIEKAQVNLDELEKDRGERGEDHPEVENFLDAYRKWNRDRKVHIQYEKLSDGAYAASVRTHLFGNLAIASLIQEKRLDRFLDFSRLFALNFSNSMLKRDLDWQARIREVHKLDPEADMLFFVGGAHDPKIILKGVANQEAIGFEDPIFDSISVVPGLEKKLLEEGPDSFSDSKNNESVLTLLLDYFFVGPAINELKGDFRLRSRGEYLLLRQFVLENIKKRYGGVDGYFQQSLVDGKFASFPDLQSQVKHIRAVEGKSLGYRKMSDGIYGKLFGGDDRLGIVIFPADNLSPELAVGIRRALINQPRLIVRVIDDGTNYKLLDQLKINVAMFSRRFEVVAAAGQESVSATIRRVIQDRDLRLFHIAKSLDPSLSNLQILSRISVWAPLSELNSLNAGHVSAITAILNDRDLIQKNQEGLSRLYQFGVARKLAANQGVLDRDLRDDLHEQRSGEFVFLDFAIYLEELSRRRDNYEKGIAIFA